MDNNFPLEEKLYRAVFPPEIREMFWKENGKVSSAAFLDKKGLSVERGNFRQDSDVLEKMKSFFIGKVISVTVKNCFDIKAIPKYLPSERSVFHSEIHGSETVVILSPSQRKVLAENSETVGDL